MKTNIINGTLNVCDIFALESFYTIQSWEIQYIDKFAKFLLDSGAFTFITSKKKTNINWVEYADSYADFIKQNKIQLYFELDIDKIIGYKAVLKLRERIENRSGVQSIPVWHLSRGKEDFIDMCKNYPYVALGGIAAKEIPIGKYEKYMPWFINTAHELGVKIHGLGYTRLNNFVKIRFDSVDSTTWLEARKFGRVCRFNGKTIDKYASFSSGKKTKNVIDPEIALLHNFKEWMKFAEYAKRKL